MKNIIISFILIFLLSGCTYLEGINSINTTENQILIEKKLTENTQLEKDNITVTNSIITAINNLNQLQSELDKLNKDIENISYNIENVSNDDNLNTETIDYLNQLNILTQKSSMFVNELHKSTVTWRSYLLRQNKTNLNFTDDSQEIIDSVNNPLKVFENNQTKKVILDEINISIE